ncbi:hypothetical protein VM1G_04811 [Cytospora mali]|uniref:Uncharacterized protein n=1 Tax=Cytospora mali TaxID=578113 RepID=A0A194VZ11_CYTMA|nr:hypothetical protein VM1G_04811 [Valsa mali]
MAEYEHLSDNIHTTLDESLESEEDMDGPDDSSFGLGLEINGEEGGFHTSNDPTDRFQRMTVTERRGPVDIRCKSMAVIHGSYSPDSDDEATLLVYDFYFDATKRFRRITWAHVKFEFSSSVPNSPSPEIDNIAPFGWWSLLETSQEEHIERGAEVNLSAGYGGASLGSTQKWSKAVDRTTTDSSMLRGRTLCNENGKETGVEFVLHENATTKKGIPSFLRTAVLLKRKTGEQFECAVKIDMEADWRTQMTRLFAAKDEDDPVYFDPELPPTNKLKDFKDKFLADNLGSIKLDEIFDTTIYTTFGNPVKIQTKATS